MPAFLDSQGTTLTFGTGETNTPVTFYCTSIAKSTEGAGDLTDQRVDVSTLDLASGTCRTYRDPPLKDCGAGGSDGTVTFQVEYYGSQEPEVNVSRALKITQKGVGAAGADVKIFDGNATCTSVSNTWATGEVVTGSATFAVDEEDKEDEVDEV